MEQIKARKWLSRIEKLHRLNKASKVWVFSAVLFMFLLHLSLSIYDRDFTWLASFGALLSIFGMLMSISYSFPLSDINEKDLEVTKEDDIYVDGGMTFGWEETDPQKITEIKKDKLNAVLNRYKNITLYFVFTILGTLIWAYAGFLNKLFSE